jgi:hypothetical protein
LYAGRNIIRVQFTVICYKVWLGNAVVVFVVVVAVVVIDGIKICNRMLATQTQLVFLISVSS